MLAEASAFHHGYQNIKLMSTTCLHCFFKHLAAGAQNQGVQFEDAWHEHQQLFTVSPANYNLLGQSMELIDRLKLGCWVLVYHQHETALVYPSILQYALPLVHTEGQRCNRCRGHCQYLSVLIQKVLQGVVIRLRGELPSVDVLVEWFHNKYNRQSFLIQLRVPLFHHIQDVKCKRYWFLRTIFLDMGEDSYNAIW